MALKEYELGGKRFLFEEGQQPAEAVEVKSVKPPANKARAVAKK